VSADPERIEEFDCFGSSCAALVSGSAGARSAGEAASSAKRSLLDWHTRFSRFLPTSELSLLNDDPRHAVSVGALMARFVAAACAAGRVTGGLVDATLLAEIEGAGYIGEPPAPLALSAALALAPTRAPAGHAPIERWRQIQVDLVEGIVRRPPGIRLDSGGLAKGLFADVLAARLAHHPSFAINCAGDLMIGGSARLTRPVEVESPFDGQTLHTFELRHGGVATSGIGRRSWLQRSGAPAHHLLDPASGRAAFTGVVQVTALAPSALLAEIRAKAALLSGPRGASRWLRDGGVIVFDDGSHEVRRPPVVLSAEELSSYRARGRGSHPLERVANRELVSGEPRRGA
jgi:thiamine biosynthesis lipoprotein